MRAAISLMVTGWLFSYLAVNTQSTTHHLTKMFSPTSNSQMLMLAKSKPKKPQPKKPPYRGSGRRQISYVPLSTEVNNSENSFSRGSGRSKNFIESFSDTDVV